MSNSPENFTHNDMEQRDLMRMAGLPTKKYRGDNGVVSYFKGLDTTNIKRAFQVYDQIQFQSRFHWHNLPEGITSEDIERLLYFRGQGALFLHNDLNKFFFLPYSMTGEAVPGIPTGDLGVNLDFTGKFRRIKPMTFNGEATASTTSVNQGVMPPGEKAANAYLGTIVKHNITDIPDTLSMSPEQLDNLILNGAVICNDYSIGLSQVIVARSNLNAAFINEIENVIINLKAAILNSTGFNLFGIADPEQMQSMQMQLDAITEARHKGQVAAAVNLTLADAKNVQTNAPSAISLFFEAFQSWDTWRQAVMGIDNALSQGTQYTNIAETTMNANSVKQVYFNAFWERVKFAAISNAIWALNIYPDPVLLTGMSFGMQTAAGEMQALGGSEPAPSVPANESSTEESV